VKYEVYENRATKTGRRIPLNIILLPARSSKPAPDPVFYLAGGPGAGASGYAEATFMEGLRRNRDVVLVDQRGTGESNPLNCAPFGTKEDMRGYFGEQFPIEKVRACRAELEKVADLKLYTTSIAMDDLDEVRAALGYDRINVYGGSYGSTTSLVYLRQHGDHVRSVAIFGVAPPSAKIPLSFAKGVQDAVNRMFADCAADQACKAAYPDVEAEFKKVLARFDNGPVEIDIPNIYTRSSQKVSVTRDASPALRPKCCSRSAGSDPHGSKRRSQWFDGNSLSGCVADRREDFTRYAALCDLCRRRSIHYR
jgi:pimeloyl-ACP methyl ester carboxylesterase